MTSLDGRPWVRLYPPGIGADLSVRHRDMLELWDEAVRRHADQPCVYYFDSEFSYRQLDEDSDALASGLIERGFQPGERLGVMLQNDPQWLVSLLATWKAGGIAVSFSPMLKSRELAFQVADSEISVLVCFDSLYRDVAKTALAAATVDLVLTTHPREWLGDAEAPAIVPPAVPLELGCVSLRSLVDRHRGGRPDRPALEAGAIGVLMYTSGTTGPAKAAMLTHAGLCHNSQLVVEWFGLKADEPVLGLAPLFHVTGLVMHLGASWYAGSAVVLSHRFDAAEILASIGRRRVGFAIAATTAYIALLNHPGLESYDLSSWRVAASGGAPVTMDVVRRFRDATGLTISSVYGLTETTSPSHLTPPGHEPPVDEATGALSVGIPVPGANVAVVDTESGEPVPVGDIGELTISGPMVVPGYWRKPEQTALAIPAGVLFTGDVGRMTAEGWFFVVDRKKDLIVASGFNVWPREVEEVLCEHEAVSEAAVIGEADPYRGETVAAWVVLLPGETLSEAELISFCRERLAAYKYPRRVTFVEQLPKTSSGKVMRRALRGEGGQASAVR